MKEWDWLISLFAFSIMTFHVELALSQNISGTSQKQKNIKSETNVELERVGNMVKIPAGVFWMGSNTEEGFRNEYPFHPVYLNEFWIDVNEVTMPEYTEFLNAGGNDDHYHPLMRDDQICGIFRYPNGRYAVTPGRENYPITYVTWEDAQSYAQWAGKRLLTEAEWECAARGGIKKKKYSTGNSISHNTANYMGRRKNLFGDYTSPVGAYPPNEYGIYDMSGNVWEWVQDYFDPYFYKADTMSNPVNDPTDYTNWRGRVIRGGSYADDAEKESYLRVSCRGPHYPIPENWIDRIGFRCASSIRPKDEKQRTSIDSAIDSLRMNNPELYKNLTNDSLRNIILQHNRPPDYSYKSGIKSMAKAVVFSAVLPGTGQFYTGRWATGLIFIGVEAAGWASALGDYSRADNIDTEYRSYALVHFDYERYNMWISRYRESNNGHYPSFYENIELPIYVGYQTEVVINPQTGKPITIQYPNISKQTEYYTRIAKYDQFLPGWDDYNSTEGINGKSRNRDDYKSARDFRTQQKKKFKKKAKIAVIVIAGNHLASIIDTIIGMKRHSIYRMQGWSWEVNNYRFNGNLTHTLNIRYRW